jgi:hypothetical protein
MGPLLKRGRNFPALEPDGRRSAARIPNAYRARQSVTGGCLQVDSHPTFLFNARSLFGINNRDPELAS